MTKKKRKPSRGPARPTAQIDRIYELMDEGDFSGAHKLAVRIVEKHPRDAEALEAILTIYISMGNYPLAWDVSNQLCAIEPNNLIHVQNQITLSITNNLPFTAQALINKILPRLTDEEPRETLYRMKKTVDEACLKIREGDTQSAALSAENAIKMEAIQIYMQIDKLELVRKLAWEILESAPDLIAPRNNIALTHMLAGELDTALEYANQTIEKAPDNFHALANLAQIKWRMGKADEARQIASKLIHLPDTNADYAHKVIETLAYLGDYAAIRKFYEHDPRCADPEQRELTTHLIAVALARTGDEKRARKLWKTIVANLELAQDNLEDLEKPIGERSGAWPFGLFYWVPRAWLEKLASVRAKSSTSLTAELRKTFATMPYLEGLLPILFEHGDPLGREFALDMAINLELPILLEFGKSPHGPDTARTRALSEAINIGLLKRGTIVTGYSRGKQTELQPMAYKITWEPSPSSHPKKIQRLIERAHALTSEGKLEEAEVLVDEGLSLLPDERTLLNYKFGILKATHRKAESRVILERTLEAHPDYFFGRCSKAEILVEDGHYDEAQAILDELHTQAEFHGSEFLAMASAFINLFLAQKNKEAAKTWLDMLENLFPDHPVVTQLRRKVSPLRFGIWR